MAAPRSPFAMLNAKRVEPNKRMVGGRFGWAIHKYPIKGGISFQDAMSREIYTMLGRTDPLFKLSEDAYRRVVVTGQAIIRTTPLAPINKKD